ncbi:hypothetical protein [Streptomyces sp. NPDC005538]|uniref:hypothetical protein n=1 Tax=unclassified Streptomyces TaxID=2593676 RepID=UPI0033B01A0F
MRDSITKRFNVKDRGLPDINSRNKRIVTPEIITLIYVPDDPGPVNGIYPVRVEVEGPCRRARPSQFPTPRRTTEWFYRNWPEFWPDWLITFAANHRPNQ